MLRGSFPRCGIAGEIFRACQSSLRVGLEICWPKPLFGWGICMRSMEKAGSLGQSTRFAFGRSDVGKNQTSSKIPARGFSNPTLSLANSR